MTPLNCLGIYADAINQIVMLCETAVDRYDCDPKGELGGRAQEYLEQTGNWNDITNSIILAYLRTTSVMIKSRHPKWNIEYYVNCYDSHLYINDREFFRY